MPSSERRRPRRVSTIEEPSVTGPSSGPRSATLRLVMTALVFCFLVLHRSHRPTHLTTHPPPHSHTQNAPHRPPPRRPRPARPGGPHVHLVQHPRRWPHARAGGVPRERAQLCAEGDCAARRRDRPQQQAARGRLPQDGRHGPAWRDGAGGVWRPRAGLHRAHDRDGGDFAGERQCRLIVRCECTCPQCNLDG